MDNIFFRGIKKNKIKNFKIQKNISLINGFMEQKSPACAAAVVAGVFNSLSGIKNTNINSVKINEILKIYREHFRNEIDKSKKKLEEYTNNNFYKLLDLIKKILKKKKNFFWRMQKNTNNLYL